MAVACLESTAVPTAITTSIVFLPCYVMFTLKPLCATIEGRLIVEVQSGCMSLCIPQSFLSLFVTCNWTVRSKNVRHSKKKIVTCVKQTHILRFKLLTVGNGFGIKLPSSRDRIVFNNITGHSREKRTKNAPLQLHTCPVGRPESLV
jgi:hypothetical protein